MRIVILTQVFAPEMGALAARLQPLAEVLRDAGHEVTIATGMPNYPAGTVFPGYEGRRTMTEDRDGITVQRTRSYMTARNVSTKAQLRSYLSFLPAVFRSAWRAGKADVVVVSSPPLFPVIPAVWLARFRRARLVVDLRDLWPDEIVAMGAATEDSRAVKVMRRLERWAYRRASLVTCTTPAFMRTVGGRGVPESRLALIPNGSDVDLFRPLPRDNPVAEGLGAGDRFVVMYSGLLGLKHGLGTLVDVAERLRDHPDIAIVLVGEGPARADIEARVARAGLTNVVLAGQRALQDVPAAIARADVCVTNLLADAYLEKIIPVKIFEYMACERPVVAGVRGEGARVVVESDAGVVVPPSDPDAMAAAILSLRDDPGRRAAMGERGRRYVEQGYSRRATAKRFEELVRGLAAR